MTSEPRDITLPEPDAVEAGLPRAAHLIGNYLYNEDGEDEQWLEEALGLVQAAIRATPSTDLDVSDYIAAFAEDWDRNHDGTRETIRPKWLLEQRDFELAAALRALGDRKGEDE